MPSSLYQKGNIKNIKPLILIPSAYNLPLFYFLIMQNEVFNSTF